MSSYVGDLALGQDTSPMTGQAPPGHIIEGVSYSDTAFIIKCSEPRPVPCLKGLREQWELLIASVGQAMKGHTVPSSQSWSKDTSPRLNLQIR